MSIFELQSEQETIGSQHSTSAYTALNSKDQEAIREADGLIFMKWPTPKLTADERTIYAEDLAILCKEFHGILLRDSVAWHRQHSKRRPTAAELRERCEVLRAQANGRQEDKGVRDMQEYERRIETHPEEFVPVALIIRDVQEYVGVRVNHFGHEPVDPIWRDEWWQWRNAATEAEWADWRAQGVKAVGFKDEPRDRSGRIIRPAGELSKIGGAA